MPDELYPLRFRPLFRRYLWGGRRLGTTLGKPIGPENDFAESWEIVDHGKDQSIVAHGPLEGHSLHEVITQHSSALMGKHGGSSSFPLLFKFLDASQTLSVQVHPNDEQAQRQNRGMHGKTEAWVVVDAEPGSVVYAGLKRGFDRPVIERELQRGTIELCLNRFEPGIGDCIFIPAGTVHALGKGLLIAEIQQASDTTFRLYDWNRLGSDGAPRALHLEEGMAVVDFNRGPISPQVPQPTDHPGVSRLISCDQIVLDRWRIDTDELVGGDDVCHIIAVLSGRLRLVGDACPTDLTRGQTALLPACLGPVTVIPLQPVEFLDAYLP